MSIVKRILILANSVKHAPGRCIAGRELVAQGQGPSRLGSWIRPISADGTEGTLNFQHRRVDGDQPIGVPDLYEVPLVKHAGDPTQPENWLVDPTKLWTRIAPWPAARMREVYESPNGLWLEPGSKSDRVSVDYLTKHPPKQSICIIPLKGAAVHPDGYSEGRHRLLFEYQDVRYDLKITDPLLPQHANGAVAPIAACISLTPPFKGDHYKLIATIFWPGP